MFSFILNETKSELLRLKVVRLMVVAEAADNFTFYPPQKRYKSGAWGRLQPERKVVASFLKILSLKEM